MRLCCWFLELSHSIHSPRPLSRNLFCKHKRNTHRPKQAPPTDNPPTDTQPPPAAPLILCGQPALSNTLANVCEAAAAAWRMQRAGKSSGSTGRPARVEPSSPLGKQLLELLDRRRQQLERQLAEPADGDAPGLSTAGEDGAAAAGHGDESASSADRALYAAAYPDAPELIGSVVEGLKGGAFRLWVVPFAATNPDGSPPQVRSAAWPCCLVLLTC